MHTIKLPTKKGQPNTNPTIEFNQMVIIGANGSGKTRFGSNIETSYMGKTHRISAQKSLSFPSEISPKSKQRAENEFYYGTYNESFNEDQQLFQKTHSRWGNNLNTFLLNDYGQLMVLLHTEEYEESLSYKEGRISKPKTALDRVQRIWEIVLPHRKLFKRAGVLEAYSVGREDEKYNAQGMSDGERVIFYLIGEVICAPKNCIIIIDEPEMHIHRSLVKTLFDLVEIERTDCSFIYLTHDIDFAFTRQNAEKIWAKSYENGDIWDYEFLKDESPIPEQLYLEVLGSRKPVLFLEGENSSIDYELYEQVYSDYTIKPLGSCEKVIQSVKALNEQMSFHHIKSFGLIDRDRRSDAVVARLNLKQIWVLEVAEAENLLLLESIVKIISIHMGKDPEKIFIQVKGNLLEYFNTQLDAQIIMHFKESLRTSMLDIANFTSKNIGDAIVEIDQSFNAIEKQKFFDEIKNEFLNVITTKDYNAVLRLFNLKNALIPNSKICELTGVRNKEEYLNLVISLLKKNETISEEIKKEIKSKVTMISE